MVSKQHRYVRRSLLLLEHQADTSEPPLEEML